MKMRKGIMVHNQLPDGYDAITINSGTVFHKKQKTVKVNYQEYNFTPQYEEQAYVVKRDWRKLMDTEINCLRSNKKRNDYNTVYLGAIPEYLKSSFQQLELTNCKNRDEVMAQFSKDPGKTKDVSEKINQFLEPLSGGKNFHFHCLGVNLPNIEMVACNTTKLPEGYTEEDKQYMGLHNDGTQHMTLHTAHKFGNRISINLSNETRSFFFMNISMIQVLNMLKKKIDFKKNKVDISNVAPAFLKHYPDYPVIQVKQKPYEYYIAPTDNCFHDGSTLGSKSLDMTIVYFGAFQY